MNVPGNSEISSEVSQTHRIWIEDSYQEVLEILREVRTKDIETYVNGEAPLLPQKLRKRIHDFLSSNGL